jgi:hypothetical protein
MRKSEIAMGAMVWRGLWRVQIQEYLVSAVQNIQVLLRYGSYLKTSPSVMMEQIKGVIPGVIRSFLDYTELMSSKISQRVLFGFAYLGYQSLEVRFLNILNWPFEQQPVDVRQERNKHC